MTTEVNETQDLDNTTPTEDNQTLPDTPQTPTEETSELEAPAAEDVVEPQEEKVELTPEQQEAFNKAYFEKMQAKREADALKAEIEALKGNKPAPEAPQETKKTLEDFDFDDAAYNEYIIEQKVEAKLAAKQKELEANSIKQQQEAESAKVMQDFNDKAETYAQQNPSYSEALANANLVQYSKDLATAVITEGPQLDHHLLANPALVDELNTLSGYALGKKLTTILDNLNKKATVKHSSAPTPPPVVKGGSGRAIDVNDPNISTEEYYALEMERLKAKAKNR